MRFILLAPAVMALALGMRTNTSEPPEMPRVSDYQKWKLVTPKPLDMDPVLAAMCRPPKTLLGATGHGARYFRVYVSRQGAKAMAEGGLFPVGSTIVKEKLEPSGKDYKVELLTVMTKHEKGFNSKAGDWDFFVTDAKGTRITVPQEISNCVSCHTGYSDMVFRTYVPRK